MRQPAGIIFISCAVVSRKRPLDSAGNAGLSVGVVGELAADSGHDPGRNRRPLLRIKVYAEDLLDGSLPSARIVRSLFPRDNG